MHRYLNSWFLHPLLDLLYPPVCWLCSGLLPDRQMMVCRGCLDQLAPFRAADDCFRDRVNAFDRVYIMYEFDDTLRRLVHLLKYRHCRGLAGLLTEHARERFFLDSAGYYSCIAAVPLHPARERDRGYNQSTLLAQALAAQIDAPCEPAVLRRIRPTPSQTRLSRSARIQNVAGAFELRSKIPGEQVLLVDDVITTGSTVNACAEVLKAGGIRTVDIFTLANPIPGKDHLAG